MEALQAWVQSNTLQQLEELEVRANRDTRELSEAELKIQEITALEERVVELTRRKNYLQQCLKHVPTDSLGAQILSTMTVQEPDSLVTELTDVKEVVTNTARLQKCRQLEYMLVAQRCAGITATLIKGEKATVRINFETMHNGEYFEPFYLQVQFMGKSVKSIWHTIPAFVPLAALTDRYNNTEIHFTSMLHIIHNYLTAFVRRRQQAMEFASKFTDYLQEDIASFYAYDFIQLILDVPIEGVKESLTVHLHYRDLRSDLPTRVRCTDPGHLPVGRARIKQAFRTLPMAEAFQNLFLDQSILQG